MRHGYVINSVFAQDIRVGDVLIIKDERMRVVAKEGTVITVVEYPTMWTWVKQKTREFFRV